MPSEIPDKKSLIPPCIRPHFPFCHKTPNVLWQNGLRFMTNREAFYGKTEKKTFAFTTP